MLPKDYGAFEHESSSIEGNFWGEDCPIFGDKREWRLRWAIYRTLWFQFSGLFLVKEKFKWSKFNKTAEFHNTRNQWSRPSL